MKSGWLAGCGRLQLGVACWATSVALLQVVDNSDSTTVGDDSPLGDFTLIFLLIITPISSRVRNIVYLLHRCTSQSIDNSVISHNHTHRLELLVSK